MKKTKQKIIDLVEKVHDMNVQDAINYVKSCFPKDEYMQCEYHYCNDFFIDDRYIIYLSKNNATQLIIKYPGGDRFGNSISDPYIDIYFYIPGDYNIYLFTESKYNSENQILEKVDDFLKETELSPEYISNVLDDCWNYLPIDFLKILDWEALSNTVVKEKIVEKVKDIASIRKNDANDQYMFGHYGGEDVSDWELSESYQFKMIWNELPKLVSLACHDELYKAWLMIEDTYNDHLKKKKSVEKSINKITYLEQNREKYIKDIHNRYLLLRKIPIDSAVSLENIEQLNKIGDMHNDLEDVTINITEINELEFTELTIKKLSSENDYLSQTINNLSSTRFYFWQWKKKKTVFAHIIDSEKRIKDNKVVISKMQREMKSLKNAINIIENFKKDLDEIIQANPMQQVASLFWKYDFFDSEEANLLIFPEEDYIEMVNQKIDHEISKLTELNKEISVLDKVLSEIADLKSEKVIS